jgi:predicted NUDIX family NTP pyrophosphohydrolase
MTPIKQKSGKVVYVFAFEHDFDITQIKSNTFTMEWPPKSGKQQEFPEIDKGEWFDYITSKQKLNDSQAAIIDELAQKLNLTNGQLKSKTKVEARPNNTNPTQPDLFG